MTKIKRFYDVHEPNENFLLLRKGHFLSRKRGRLFKKYCFRSLNGAFNPRKKGTFFTFKKSGAHASIAPPPPSSAAPAIDYMYTVIAMYLFEL
jgi:hypothetical protein